MPIVPSTRPIYARLMLVRTLSDTDLVYIVPPRSGVAGLLFGRVGCRQIPLIGHGRDKPQLQQSGRNSVGSCAIGLGRPSSISELPPFGDPMRCFRVVSQNLTEMVRTASGVDRPWPVPSATDASRRSVVVVPLLVSRHANPASVIGFSHVPIASKGKNR